MNLLCEAHTVRDGGGPDVRREAEARRVGARNDVVERVEPEDGLHRTEDFFARDRLRLVARREDRRPEIIAAGERGVGRPCAAQQGLDALLVGLRAEALDPLAVLRRDQRTQIALARLRVADAQRAHALEIPLEEPLVNSALHVQARAGQTHLAAVTEHGQHAAVDGELEVGVVAHDVGRLSAELQRHFLERRRGGGVDRDAGRLAAGERDRIDARVGDQRRAGLRAETGHDVDDAVGHARFAAELGQAQRRERRELRRLEHARVPDGNGGSDLPSRLHQRRVPRGEQRADADRLFAHQRDHLAFPAEKRFAVEERALLALLDRAREERAVVGGARNVAVGGLAERFSRVARLERGKLFAVADEQLGQGSQHLGALRNGCARPRPVVEGAPRRRDRTIDVVRASARDAREDLAAGGIDVVVGRAV